ncbi:MAG: redoxin family protein [Phycisphaerales bacterium]|nr:redoxin family protein [Phycisphaerales bacterium]
MTRHLKCPLFLALASLAMLVGLSSTVDAQDRGIAGRSAPAWQVDEWFNLPKGVESIDVTDYRGKVIYFYGFQSWCPSCHSRGFPTLKELIKRYRGNEDVVFVAVQTVFEGYATNTPIKARMTGQQHGLEIPIGHSGSLDKPSPLMRSYRTGGTPWTIIIDRDGVVRYNDFHISPDQGQKLIDELLKAPMAKKKRPKIETLPESRGGQNIVGKTFPKLQLDRWAKRAAPGKKKPQATLYRWWTNTCPWCEASLPAIEKLRLQYEKDGLRTVAVYHPKPPREETDEVILLAARDIGYHGDVAVDLDWSELRRAYLDSNKRGATSVSILVDEDGVVRFVHPGPVFFPSSDPAEARENADYLLLEKAIQSLVAPASD